MFKNVNGQRTTDNRLCPHFSCNLNGKEAHNSLLIAQS